VVAKYNLDESRYDEFKYLCYLDLNDEYVRNYVQFQLGYQEPIIKGRIRAHAKFWQGLAPPDWLMQIITTGMRIPFARPAPRIVLPNNKSAASLDAVPTVRLILDEYLRYGFVKKVSTIPHCVMPLQIKETGGKTALIYDMSVLNDYVHTASFKLEGWEEMVHYAKNANWAIKFDLKKFYHEIDIDVEHQKYFGFMYSMADGQDAEYFVWTTLPYGYTRAPYIARQLLKPLIAKWRRLGAFVVVFYDDGMAVSKDPNLLAQLSLQMQCDLLNAGLVPGVGKCIWTPQGHVDWNGLTFDLHKGTLSIMAKRIEKVAAHLEFLRANWPHVTYRQVAKGVGQLISLSPVFGGVVQIRSRMLQTIVNIRHFNNYQWDHKIKVSFPPLLNEGLAEVIFWQKHSFAKNERKLKTSPPTWMAWSDASDMAIGGFVARLEGPKNAHAVTVDNWLLNSADMFEKISHCAQLQVDTLPWSHKTRIQTRDQFDLSPEGVSQVLVCHRNLDFAEKATDSNERELLAALHILISCLQVLKKCTVTLHMDNMNAVVICVKGSPKPRLQVYAKLISQICTENDITLNPVWIPRDLNQVADLLSKEVDFDDYAVRKEFFDTVCRDVGTVPEVDLVADNKNCNTRSRFIC